MNKSYTDNVCLMLVLHWVNVLGCSYGCSLVLVKLVNECLVYCDSCKRFPFAIYVFCHILLKYGVIDKSGVTDSDVIYE